VDDRAQAVSAWGFNREQTVAGVGGFKKGVGFQGFCPNHTTHPSTQTGEEREEKINKKRARKKKKNERSEARRGEGGGIIPRAGPPCLRDLAGRRVPPLTGPRAVVAGGDRRSLPVR
jgi:hypothetical protein